MTRQRRCRLIAAVLLICALTPYLARSHREIHYSKEAFLDYQSRLYDSSLRQTSVFRALAAAAMVVGGIVIIYEGVTILLLRVLPDSERKDKNI